MWCAAHQFSDCVAKTHAWHMRILAWPIKPFLLSHLYKCIRARVVWVRHGFHTLVHTAVICHKTELGLVVLRYGTFGAAAASPVVCSDLQNPQLVFAQLVGTWTDVRPSKLTCSRKC